MQRLVLYHAVRDTTHLYLSWRATRNAPALAKNRARAHAGRCSPPLPCPAIYLHYSKSFGQQGQKGLAQPGHNKGIVHPPLPIQRDQRG